jgi:soluble lytic murein transglycosylase
LLVLLCLGSCAAQDNAAFYDGLLHRAEAPGQADSKAAAFFEQALRSPNAHIRSAAAAELLSLRYGGAEIPNAALDRARREAAGSWAAALNALAAADSDAAREPALAALLGSGGGNAPDEAALYLLRECRRRDADFFSEAENAAIDGHFAAAQSRFREALGFFRIVFGGTPTNAAAGEKAADGSPAALPELFSRHPNLLDDLGRCFQYATADGEGIDLLLEWEHTFAAGLTAESGHSAAGNGVRFRLLFFAARIARQRGRVDQSVELFGRALPFAPSALQADACIWYLLDTALGRGPAAAIRQMKTYAPRWHDPAYFNDILDRLARELAAQRQWQELVNTLAVMRNYADPASVARYAYIIGRALEAGYFSTTGMTAADYLRIAYETGGASFYYRAQSAAALGKPFLELPAADGSPDVPSTDIPSTDIRSDGGKSTAGKTRSPANKADPAMTFLRGFFSHRAAEFAPPYIRAMEAELSVADLRTLAGDLAAAGLYAESMRLVTVYTGRNDYQPANGIPPRRDLELYYPRPFKDLVEQYAAEAGVAPALLFGLIRTESAFQSDVVSRAGAAGLTQLMPATAEEMAGRIHRQGGPDYAANDGPDLRDPAVNIHIGAVYLGYLMERLEAPLPALLAYNGGMNRVRRWRTADSRKPGGALPLDLFLETVEYSETREYGRRVLAAAAVYKRLYYE